MRRYYLSLGSNLDPECKLAEAVQKLRQYGKILAVSSVYISPPYGTEDPQPDYLNAVVVLGSDQAPDEFQERVIRAVEKDMGRERSEDRFAPRVIDIDILMVDQEVLEIDHRQVPSPEILERSFVALPLAEVAPDIKHPLDGRTISEIAEQFDEDLGISTLRLD